MTMMKVRRVVAGFCLVLGGAFPGGIGPARAEDSLRPLVDAAVAPVMTRHDVPGLSVGILLDGVPHVFHYGVMSRQGKRPVDDRTLFEIGSLSKPFTGTLLARLEAEGRVDLSRSAGSVLPALAGSAIGKASLLELHTYTGGGLPLQVPDGVDRSNVVDVLRAFTPTSKPGESRLYSNFSIGLSAFLAETQAGEAFAPLLQDKILSPLKLADTMLTVPDARKADYAQGYTRDNAPVRVTPGLFDQEAYGIKTTARDLLRFLAASRPDADLDPALAAGFKTAREGVYRVRAMHQGMGWELYPAPARLAELLQGADPDFVLKPNVVERGKAPVHGAAVGTVSKTGSTAGFGAYALFQPARDTGVVILANRFWPNDARIELAERILARLDPGFFAR